MKRSGELSSGSKINGLKVNGLKMSSLQVKNLKLTRKTLSMILKITGHNGIVNYAVIPLIIMLGYQYL